jgi:type II secretory pathway component PulM
VKEKLAPLLANVKRAFDDLSEREQKLVIAMSSIALAMLVVLPMYFVGSSVAELEDDNAELSAVIAEIESSRKELIRRKAEEELMLARYDKKAPPLGTFIEQEARKQQLALKQVVDQPREALGDYTRRRVRVDMQKVSMRPILELLASLENSPYPVTVDRLQIDHPQEGDVFNVQIGISTYDRTEPGEEDETARGTR